MGVLTLKQSMVRQEDELVLGILTVGLLRTNANGDAGIQVVLGCLLGGWGVDPRQTAIASKWIIELDEKIKAAIMEHFRTTPAIDLHRSWLPLAEAAYEHLYHGRPGS
ncbi:hypothetical protein BDW66DRAFT_147798 [Aspergillus desertorum]